MFVGMEGKQPQNEPFWDMFQRVCASSSQVCLAFQFLVYVPTHASLASAYQMTFLHAAAASGPSH